MKITWFFFIMALALTVPGRSWSQELKLSISSKNNERSFKKIRLDPLEMEKFMLRADITLWITSKHVELLTTQNMLSQMIVEETLGKRLDWNLQDISFASESKKLRQDLVPTLLSPQWRYMGSGGEHDNIYLSWSVLSLQLSDVLIATASELTLMYIIGPLSPVDSPHSRAEQTEFEIEKLLMIQIPRRIPSKSMFGGPYNFSPTTMALIGNVMAGVTTWWIIRQAMRIKSSNHVPKKMPSGVSLSPLLNLSQMGVSVLVEF